MIISSILLLFGAQLRDLAFPASADLAVDCVFLVVIAFLLVDIVSRCDAEPHYFSFWACPRQNPVGPTGPTTNNHWTMGSFLFWCDVLSTVTLLYDVRLFTERSGVQEVVIELSDQGIPVCVCRSCSQWKANVSLTILSCSDLWNGAIHSVPSSRI